MASVKFSFLAISCLVCILVQCGEVQPWSIWPSWPSWPSILWPPSHIPKLVPNMRDLLEKLASKAVKDGSKIFQDPVTRALCQLKTVYRKLIFQILWVTNFWTSYQDELIEYYGYKSEVHKVITQDGYITTGRFITH